MEHHLTERFAAGAAAVLLLAGLAGGVPDVGLLFDEILQSIVPAVDAGALR